MTAPLVDGFLTEELDVIDSIDLPLVGDELKYSFTSICRP